MSGTVKPFVRPGVAQPGQSAGFGASRPQVQLLPPGRDEPPISEKIAVRFWAKVEKHGPDECWPWTASQWKGGYGCFKLPDRSTIVASRYAYFLVTKHWPGRYLVCHSCDNPPCCNPAHLWLGLHKDNSDDKISKGRARTADMRGSRNGHAKLTEGDVERIRERIAAGETNVAIAPAYGVHHSTISLIRGGKFWKHVA